MPQNMICMQFLRAAACFCDSTAYIIHENKKRKEENKFPRFESLWSTIQPVVNILIIKGICDCLQFPVELWVM